MTIEPPSQMSSELYWGFGMPTESAFALFRDRKTCELTRQGWPVLANWQKTECQPLVLRRGATK